MNPISGKALFAALFGLILVLGCNFYYEKPGGQSLDPVDLSGIDLSKISWQQVQRFVFTPHCVSCHATFGNYQKVKQSLNWIQDEVIVKRSMPPSDEAPLSSEKIEILKRWIESGAPEQVISTSTPSPAPSSPPPEEPLPTPPLENVAPTYASIREHILVPKCLECHSPNGTAAKVPLSTLHDLIDSPLDLISKEEPDESALMIAITRSDNKRMPPPRTGPGLNPQEIEAIRTWIRKGATD